MEANWFVANKQEIESVLFYAFVDAGKVDTLFEMVEYYNVKQVTKSNIHLAVLNIEKSN